MAEEKKIELKIISLLMIGFWFAGLAVVYFLGLGLEPLFDFGQLLNGLLLTLTVFVFAVLFFGFLTPAIFFAIGLMQGIEIIQNPFTGLYFIPTFIAGYSGSMLGQYLFRDLKGQDNVFAHLKPVIIQLVIALAIAGTIPFLISFIAEIELAL